jgi:hypothetical protein
LKFLLIVVLKLRLQYSEDNLVDEITFLFGLVRLQGVFWDKSYIEKERP